MPAPTIAVAHHCEGAGHASRLLAVVELFDSAGHEVILAGGGPGKAFVAANGFTEFEPPTVDFVRPYQRASGRFAVLRHASRDALARIDGYCGWLRREAPAVLLTDDIWAAVAATAVGMRYVYVSHDPAGFYADRFERAGAWLRNRFARATAERFLLPKVWRGPPTIPGAEAVPPLAPPTDGTSPDVDVLLVPSAYTPDVDALCRALEAAGRAVTRVGGDDWEVTPTLQPAVAAANLVVCSGYSTVMEAAVAGTPCVVAPATSEQRGVGRAISDLAGFYAVDDADAVVTLLDRVEPPAPRQNGAGAVADAVFDALRGSPGQ